MMTAKTPASAQFVFFHAEWNLTIFKMPVFLLLSMITPFKEIPEAAMADTMAAQTVDKAQGSRLGFFVKRAIKLPFFRIL